MNQIIKYIDLFAGVGGFHHGIDSAFCNQQASAIVKIGQGRDGKTGKARHYVHDRSITPLCVYSNEWDKYANSVYRRHYGECDIRDIRSVETSEIPDHDLLCGGFPCQSFSVAGKRGGFEDTRGTMFFEIARILKDKRPRYLLLENVKGLLTHDSGKTFATILGVLADIGYGVQWQVLNSKDFGVPQNRERVYIVGHLRGTPKPKVFPIAGSDAKNIIQLNQPKYSSNRIYDRSGIGPTLNTMQGGNRQPKVAIPVLTPDRAEKRQNGRRFKEDGEPSFTLTGQDKHGVYDGVKIRRLTPTECERLQGFPDGWTATNVNGEAVSDSQRYKMCGNAVTTNTVAAVISKLLEEINV